MERKDRVEMPYDEMVLNRIPVSEPCKTADLSIKRSQELLFDNKIYAAISA